MTKKLLSLLGLLFAAFTGSSQSWKDMMQDPSVNFYSVQSAFESYWAGNPGIPVEVYPLNQGKTPSSGGTPEIQYKKPGWKAFKRWEDQLRPRVYPTGDRMVMINAMNAYLDSVYNMNGADPTRGPGTPWTPAPTAANWTLIGPTTTVPAGGGAGRINFVRFDPTTSNTIFVGSPAGGLWKSTTSGTGWTTSTDNLAVIGCTDLAINPLNTQIMYLATGDGEAQDTYSIGVLKTTDGGVTWAPSGLNWTVTNFRVISRLLINPQNPNTIFAATSNGVYRSRNAGAAWTQIATAVANMKDIEFKPGDTTTVYACSTTGFYKSTNGGTTFTVITAGLPAAASVGRMSIAVTPANATYVYLLASNTADGFLGLYRSIDNGTTFTTRSTTPNILGYSNTGATAGGQGWYDLSLAVSPLNADQVMVGGINIWRSINGGTNWTLNANWTGSGAPYVHADIHGLEYLPGSGTTIFAASDGGLFRTTNSGTAWSDLSAGLQIAQMYRLGGSATNSNLILSGWQDNGTNRYNAGAWSEVLGGDGMESLIDFGNANVQYGELYYGEIYRTTTGGNLTTNIVASGGTGVNANGDWVTPFIINPQRATTLVVGKAAAYKSVNRGGNWTALGATTGGTGNLVALAYAPADSNYLYVAKYNRFFASSNSGTSFTDRTTGLPVASASISYIAVASNNPQHVWVTFSGYSAANKVWYSANAGVTWTNYTTGLPNLPANCIVYQNGSANDVLYVGTDVGVYVRDNTAASWTSYNTGLPNVVVKELEIQYAVSKLRAATFGRGVWQSDLYTPGTALPVADFTTPQTNICAGDCISFTDLSTASPTAWSWSFTGGTPSTSSLQNPTNICYNTPGTYAVTLTATNINGSDAETKTAYITVTSPIALPLVEGFQGTYAPAGWIVSNPDADGYTWVQSAAAGGFGTSTMSAAMNNYSPPTSIIGTIDELSTPKYNFTSISTATLTFDVAYARYSAVYADSLRVLVSTNCGSTWTQVYAKGGFTGLPTAPDNSTTDFIPTSAQWRTETVSLTPYGGQANVMVKFQNYSGWGQWMYLDNINITGAGSPVASVTIAQTSGTNPMCAGASSTFTATPTNGGTTPTYQWQVNGVNVGTGGTTYTTTTLNNGDVVTVIMTSSLPGVTGSPATSNSITMTVNPVPATPSPGSNSPVCAGATINLTTATVAGATYSWTGPASYTSTLQNPTRPSATAAMAGTYSLTVTVAGCTSAVGTTTVIVNPIPATPAAGSNSPVCAGATINLTTPTVAGATYSWTGPSGYTSSLQNPIRTGATAAMAGTYSVTITVGGCTSAAGTTAVVVNPVPATPAAGSNSPVCSGNTINLTTAAVAGATYSWTGPSSFSSSLQNPSLSAATAAMAGTYSITVTVAGCTSAAGTTAVTVNPTPATPTVTASSPVCAGSTITFATPTVAGATYAWTGPAAFSSALQNPTRPAATTAMSGTYSVTVTVGGCTSAAGTAAVVVNPLPATPTAGSNSPVCTGATINLTTPTVAGATYSWTGPATYTSSLQNPTRPSATTAMAGTYSVTVTVGGCTSAAGTTVVVVNTTPAAPIPANNGPLCEGASVLLTANNIAGATYSWTGPAGYTAGVRNPPGFPATLAAAGTYSLTVTVGGCTSPVATTTLVVNPIPATPTAGSNSPVCTGSTINLTTPTVAGASYSWTGPGGYTSSVQNPIRPSATTAMAGTYNVTVTVAGCTSAAGTVTVVVNSSITPTVSIAITSGSNPSCTGSSVTFTATPSGGGAAPAYQWQVNGGNVGTGGTTYTTTGLVTGDVITCILTSSSSCASPTTATSSGITMTVNPVPPTPVAGSNSPVCEGAVINLTTPTVAGASYNWTGPSAFTSTVQNPAIPGATALNAGTYSVTVTIGGCTSAAGITNVVVNAIPATPTASYSSPACTGTNLNLSTPTVPGATYSWTGPGAYTSSLQNPVRPSATTAMSGTYSVTVTVGGCTSAAGTVSVTVFNSVTTAVNVAITAGSNPMCSGASITFTATPTGGGPTPAYQWQVNGLNVGTSSNTYTTTSLADGDVVTVILTASNPCASMPTATSSGITMSVDPVLTPAVSIALTSGSNPACAGDPLVFTASPVNGGATPAYQWQVNGVNAGTGGASFSTSTLNNGDVVSCILTSSATCASPVTASSNSVTMTVNPIPPTPVITQSGSVLSSDAASGNQWYLDGTPIAGAIGQNHTITANGDYTVVVTVAGCSSAPSNIITITTTGINAGENPFLLVIYPNPNDGHFNVSFNSATPKNYKIELVNALGQLIFKEELKDFKGEYKKDLSVVDYGKGLYTITITDEKNDVVKKVIVY